MIRQVEASGGVISRQQAWEMWPPYGQRGLAELDGQLDAQAITPYDAVQVMAGANSATRAKINRHITHLTGDPTGIDDLCQVVTQGADKQLRQILVQSQLEQQAQAEAERRQAIDDGPAFVDLLAEAADKLAAQKVIAPKHADLVQDWLYGPDGQPYMQYTPMSRLEYGRLILNHRARGLGLNSTDYTSLELGMFPSCWGQGTDQNVHRADNRIHEHSHLGLAGVEIRRAVRPDGSAYPEMVSSGVGLYGGDVPPEVSNVEVNEGTTSYLTRQLKVVEPRLGRPVKIDASYTAWDNTIAKIRSRKPTLYKAIINANFTEATPAAPQARVEGLQRLEYHAGAMLGKPAVLSALFVKAGGSMADIHNADRYTVG